MGRTAVVTGGTRGIGYAISVALAEAGFDVVAVHKHPAAPGLEKPESHGGGHVTPYLCDVTVPNEVHGLRRHLETQRDGLEVLVNNAGVITQPAHWRQQSLADARATITANLFAAVTTVWELAPLLEQRGGRIVNVSSTYAFLGEPEILAYSVAKAGLTALTKGLARDLGPHGVTVNSVLPAVVRTEMSAAAGEEFLEESRDRTPVRRLAEPADIARAVLFLVANDMVNGVELVVDGGLHLTGP